MKKALSVILIIAAVALGAMHGHYSFLYKKGRIAENVGFLAYLSGNYKLIDVAKRPVKRAEKPVEQPAGTVRRPLGRRGEERATPTPAVDTTKPPREVVDTTKVADLISQGRQLYSSSEYKDARARLEEAIAILDKAGRKSSPHYKEAGSYAKRCRVFDALVSNIPYLELSDGQNLSKIELESGKTIVARVLKEEVDSVTIQQNDGIQATLSYDQIDAMTRVTPADYRSQLLKEYRQRYGKTDPKAYFDIFGVALFAIQNRLREEITPVLEKTFMLPGSELVMQTFYTGDDAGQLIVALLESFDKTKEAEEYRQRIELAARPPEPEYPPEPEPVQPGLEPEPYTGPEPTTPEPEPVVPSPPAPAGPPGSKAARIEKAGLYFAAGQRFANYATRNVSKRHFYGKKAYEELGKSRDILNTLQDQYPGEMEIENMLQQVSDLLQFVVHNLVGTN